MTEFAKYNAKDISGLSVARMSGKQDYLDEIKAIWFEFGRKSGIEEAEARIITLLEDTARTWRNLQYDNQADIFEHAIALINGEQDA